MRVDKPRFSPVLLPLAALLLLTACGGDQKGGMPGGPGGAMPPAEVGVITVTSGKLALTTELPGRIEAVRSAQVRARVAGIVTQRVFREGSDVKAGDVLFRIDSAPYKAAYESANASLARAEANRDQTRAQAERAQALIGKKLISQQDYDTAAASAKASAADVTAAQAALTNARLNLGYATVTAPISGRIGRALVTEGALVGQGDATPLALIQQINPIYVNFSQSSVEVLKLRQAIASGKLKSTGGQPEVTLLMEDGSVYAKKGKLLFSDLSVDPSTGSVALRAEFANTGDELLPGMYVRVRLEQAVASDAVTVPQRAVARTAQGASVMLVGADGKVAVQPVTTGAAEGDVWVITDGLKGGEQVIVEGLQKVKPGADVKAVPFTNAPAQNAAAPAQPAQAK
jgi:membrane fusion protein (multidrug efflux system)